MVAPPKLCRIELGAAVAEYLNLCDQQQVSGEIARSTLRNYARDLHEFSHLVEHDEFLRLVGSHVVVDDITGADIDRMITTYGRTPDQRFSDATRPADASRSPATQRRFRQSVSRFFGHAVLQGWVQVSPMDYTSVKPKPGKNLRTQRRSLELPQADALLLYGAGDPAGPDARPHERNHARNAYLLSLMVILGPRVHEIARANREDFSMGRHGMQWLIFGKGDTERVVPLSADLIRLREQYMASRTQPGDHLTQPQRTDAERAEFVTGRGSRISPRDIQRMLHQAFLNVTVHDPANAREATPHALRHTAATLLLSAGWDVKVVKFMLGHANISTTSLYLDEVDGELSAAMRSHPVTVARVPAAVADFVAEG